MLHDWNENASTYDFQPRFCDARLNAVPPSNLPEIIKAARHAIGPELAAEIGPLSTTPLLIEDSRDPKMDIRSEPLRAFGGAEFRQEVGIGGPSAHYSFTTECLAEGLRAFKRAQRFAARLGPEIKTLVTNAIARHDCTGSCQRDVAGRAWYW